MEYPTVRHWLRRLSSAENLEEAAEAIIAGSARILHADQVRSHTHYTHHTHVEYSAVLYSTPTVGARLAAWRR